MTFLKSWITDCIMQNFKSWREHARLHLGAFRNQDNEAHRPTMQQIVQFLQGIQDVGLPLVPIFLQQLVEG